MQGYVVHTTEQLYMWKAYLTWPERLAKREAYLMVWCLVCCSWCINSTFWETCLFAYCWRVKPLPDMHYQREFMLLIGKTCRKKEHREKRENPAVADSNALKTLEEEQEDDQLVSIQKPVKCTHQSIHLSCNSNHCKLCTCAQLIFCTKKCKERLKVSVCY